jgi:alkylation response protein AidB-like acyl-CoA dehydrogenase
MSTTGPTGWSAEDERAILDSIHTWVERELRPVARRFDQADEYPHAIVEQMKELGLFGATIGTEWGGLGLSAATYAKIVVKVASVWMAPSGIFNSHLIMASAIERFGTPEQKAEFLPRMATGEFRGGIGLTEPNAGSDLQAIRTVARADGSDYLVNGAKTWITNSGQGHGVLLLVKTDPAAQPRHKGMSLFIAEKGPGFIVSKKMKKLGYRAIDSCELSFENYRVPASRLVGGEPGRGFAQVAGGLELGRINVAARGCGIGLGALELATRYAQERQAFGKAIHEHQAIQLKLAEMATRVEASKLLIEQAALKYDSGQRCDMEAAMAKFFGSETGVFCAGEAMRIFGGYRDAMLMCIGEGTNEILQTIIAKQWIARHPA